MLNSGFLASLLGTVSAPRLQPHIFHGMCTLAFECRSFISQGSVDTRLTHSGMFNITFFANLLLGLLVIDFQLSVNIVIVSYRQEHSVLFLTNGI